MLKKMMFILLTLIFIFSCSNIFGPDQLTGSLEIIFDQSSKTPSLTKNSEELRSVFYILRKGEKRISDGELEKISTGFEAEIHDLKRGDNYSITLHGMTNLMDIAVYAHKSKITIHGNRSTKIQLSWLPFIIELLSPKVADILTDGPYQFTWNDLPEAESFNIQIDNDSTFTTPIVNDVVKDLFYTHRLNLDDGTYYWRVKAKGDYAQWSYWSAVDPFQVDRKN